MNQLLLGALATRCQTTIETCGGYIAVLATCTMPYLHLCNSQIICVLRFWKYESLRTCIFDGLLSAQNKVIKWQPASASSVFESKTSTAPHARQRRRVANLMDLVDFYKLSREKPEVVLSVLNIFSRNNASDHALH